MGCYYTLCQNTYAYSLLFYKVYVNRENADSWDSGCKRMEKEQILETYSALLQKSWNFMEVISRIYKKYWVQEVLQGGHPPATRVGGAPYPLGAPPASWAPWWPSDGHLLLYEVFQWEKIISHLLGRNSAATRRNQSRVLAGQFCRGNFPSGGGNHHHRHHQWSSHQEGVNLHHHLHQHHLISNPSSSLVSNLCIQISDWYLWVASSVDYSL